MLSYFNKKTKKKIKKYFYLPSFVLGIIFSLIFFSVIWAISLEIADRDHKKINNLSHKISDKIMVKPVSAAEIYPEFICSCCGKPLDPNNICCGDMKQKIAYIDSQVASGLSQDDIIIKATKEFGINSLAKTETKEKIKIQLAELAPADAPKIVFEKNSYDFGKVSQADGEVFTLFNFKNEGKGDLVINKLSTSCGCTSAAIVYQGKEGPSFTMPGHGKANPVNWSVSIAVGDTAQVKVYYDPNAHGKQKEDVLPITRSISIFSNDPIEFEKQIKIELDQLP